MKTYNEYIKEEWGPLKKRNWNYKLTELSSNGDLNGVKNALKNGADIHEFDDASLRWASQNGHLEVVKYLVENGANIYANNDLSLRVASEKGHLEVVKYLVENGANIYANNDLSLRMSIIRDYLNVVRYLVSVYIERNKYKELLTYFDILPEEIQEELKLKIPHIFAARDHGLI